MDEELVQQILQPYLSEQAELSLWEQLQAFYHAIDWSEGWIISLLLIHLTLFILVIVTRKIMVIQIPTFLSLLFLVYNSERINNMGSLHWKQFSTQDYFDPNGIFISALFSFPLLMMALIILINLVLENVRLLIQVKRAQVMLNNKNNKKEGSNGADKPVTQKNKQSNKKNN